MCQYATFPGTQRKFGEETLTLRTNIWGQKKIHHYSWKDLETKLFSVKKISVRPILTGKALLLLFLRNSKTNHVNKDIMNKIFLGNFLIRKNCIREGFNNKKNQWNIPLRAWPPLPPFSGKKIYWLKMIYMPWNEFCMIWVCE